MHDRVERGNGRAIETVRDRNMNDRRAGGGTVVGKFGGSAASAIAMVSNLTLAVTALITAVPALMYTQRTSGKARPRFVDCAEAVATVANFDQRHLS